MDSLTQFVLGAAVSTALLGKKLGPRKAALIGGVLGTLPDLDVLIPYDDPIDSFVYHRGWTHSVFVHALAAPLLGEGLIRLFKGLRDCRWLTWLTVFLCLATHAGIDAMTVYGTRLFWPFYPDPVGVGSVFIIDPLYTLPLLAVVIWALFRKNWTRRFQAWMTAALVVSTGYLGLSVVLQRHVEQKAQDLFRQEGILPDKVFAIAAPFNILVWKVIGLQEDRYDNLYYSLLDEGGKPEIYTHPRHPELVACVEDTQAFRKLDWFSRGYYRAELDAGKLVISDLRMGMTPNYVFRFAIAEAQDDGFREIPPRSATEEVRVDPQDWTWLTARLKGVVAVRRAEAAVAGTGEAIAGQACALAGETSG
ncbi:metal-dependent hydrolase [Roseibium algicola]|uniref:metal-dependent hydrolase n=1 Tax=Roseibium algicola TaxID=2857014 RepID=UPI0034586964